MGYFYDNDADKWLHEFLKVLHGNLAARGLVIRYSAKKKLFSLRDYHGIDFDIVAASRKPPEGHRFIALRCQETEEEFEINYHKDEEGYASPIDEDVLVFFDYIQQRISYLS